MVMLTTNMEGTGTLYDTAASDGIAYLAEGVTYLSFQSNSALPAMRKDEFLVDLILDGRLSARYLALEITNSGSHMVEIGTTGTVSSSRSQAIQVRSNASANIMNYGVISATTGVAIYQELSAGAGNLSLVNAGTIRGQTYSIYLEGTTPSSITNTGTIIGSILLGYGNDYVDTHSGTLVGYINDVGGSDTYVIRGTEIIYDYSGTNTVNSYGDHTLLDGLTHLNLLGDARRGGGNGQANTIIGTAFNDVLSGGGGNDTLQGAAGDDMLFGGSGNDSLMLGDADAGDLAYGGDGADSFSFGVGPARAFGEAGDDYFSFSYGAVALDGGAGIDTVSYALFIDLGGPINVNLATGVGTGGFAEGDTYVRIENVYGSVANDVITGSNVDNYLHGGDAGNDQLFGGNGNDRLVGGFGADLLDGGQQIDTVDYSVAPDGLGVSVNLTTGIGQFGTAQGDTYVAIENVTGTPYADTITGNVYANVLRGGAGADYLLGAQGNDTLEGGAGSDLLRGGPGADTLLFVDIVVGTPGGWGVDQIELFEDGIDVISFVGASGVTSMANLTITNQTGYVSIVTAGGDEIRLLGFTGTLDASDFLF